MKTVNTLSIICITSLLGACGSANTTDIKSELPLNPPPVENSNVFQPNVLTTWQWQLLIPNGETLNSSYNVDVYDVDLFDTSISQINALQANGRKVICYFSAGSYEHWRIDESQFPQEALGNNLDGWEGERWLDIRLSSVHEIMEARIEYAAEKQCDGVEPDNMDAYQNNSGFNLSANDQLAFNRFIANTAHEYGLSVGLKNDLDQIEELVDYYDFAVNEQCFEYDECDALIPFIDAGKPVFNAEYHDDYVSNDQNRTALCKAANALQLSTLILPLDLDDEFRYSCL
ncbi:endo alpha-1,4 polygalactosaminidase [Oceaniserpentilla sp. 4NH20-0058]|uniref:endo alpha-1,4 polygalactosaminidase n=1 Tax=Oceaniserpentilla sp. 4NH20-0058 TaxID=3127660 RepID=UPI00310C29EE